MTEATILSPHTDTSAVRITSTIRNVNVIRETAVRNATNAVIMQARTVSSSKIEGKASLRYTPREPVICNTSTET